MLIAAFKRDKFGDLLDIQLSVCYAELVSITAVTRFKFATNHLPY